MNKNEDWLKQVLRITKDLFIGMPSIELLDDPDVEDKTYIVFVVGFCGSAGEQIRQQLLWHTKVDEISDTIFSDLRLSILPNGEYVK